MDMSGGAAVIHTIALAARMKTKKNIIGLIPQWKICRREKVIDRAM